MFTHVQFVDWDKPHLDCERVSVFVLIHFYFFPSLILLSFLLQITLASSRTTGLIVVPKLVMCLQVRGDFPSHYFGTIRYIPLDNQAKTFTTPVSYPDLPYLENGLYVDIKSNIINTSGTMAWVILTSWYFSNSYIWLEKGMKFQFTSVISVVSLFSYMDGW